MFLQNIIQKVKRNQRILRCLVALVLLILLYTGRGNTHFYSSQYEALANFFWVLFQIILWSMLLWQIPDRPAQNQQAKWVLLLLFGCFFIPGLMGNTKDVVTTIQGKSLPPDSDMTILKKEPGPDDATIFVTYPSSVPAMAAGTYSIIIRTPVIKNLIHSVEGPVFCIYLIGSYASAHSSPPGSMLPAYSKWRTRRCSGVCDSEELCIISGRMMIMSPRSAGHTVGA